MCSLGYDTRLLFGFDWNYFLLSLWGRYFFNVDPGHRELSRKCVSKPADRTSTDPESHAHCAFGNLLTDSFNLAHAVQILCEFASTSIQHINHTFNGLRSRALGTVECKIPTTAACLAVIDAKIAIPKDSQSCVV